MTSLIEIIMSGAGLLIVLLFVDSVVPNSVLCQVASGKYAALVQGDLWYFLGFFLLIGISWLLAQKSTDLGTINGCGTKLYGCTFSDQGYFATKWICVFFLAVLPVASYEVLLEDQAGSRYFMNRLDELVWPQIFLTFAKSFLILLVCVGGPVLIFNLDCFLKLRL
jgi:hypothetical protein